MFFLWIFPSWVSDLFVFRLLFPLEDIFYSLQLYLLYFSIECTLIYTLEESEASIVWVKVSQNCFCLSIRHLFARQQFINSVLTLPITIQTVQITHIHMCIRIHPNMYILSPVQNKSFKTPYLVFRFVQISPYINRETQCWLDFKC